MDSIEGVATVSVPKGKAMYSSGAKKGRLRKGCRWSGRGARCTPEVAARLGVKKGKARKSTKRSKSKRQAPNRQAMMRTVGGQLFLALQNRRRVYKEALKSGSCKSAKMYGREVIGILGKMWELPVRKQGQEHKRNARYKTEMQNIAKNVQNVCKGIPAEFQGARGGRGGFSGHPCASPTPPKWCNKKKSKR